MDESSGYPCYVNDATGATQWEKPSGGDVEMSQMENPLRQGATAKQHHSRNSTQLPDGWDKHHDEEGNKYYADENSGETSWDAPPGSVGGSAGGALLGGGHGRSETVLPSGWGKDESGPDKYYYNEDTGETSWEAPPGSVGGSAGGGALLDGGHVRSETVLPSGWGKDESGPDKYYYNEESGETSW